MVASPERSAVRTAGRFARQSIRGEERRVREARLITHLWSLHAVTNARSVGVFVAHDGEPDLQPIIERSWRRGQTVAIPVLADDAADHTMRFVPWFGGDRHECEQLVPGRYDIPVPPDPERAAIQPDTLLVSLTAFDSNGGRMGRGGGFFDRYLADYLGCIVGVGFETQRTDHVPVEPHDVRLPTMVTDLGVRLTTRKHDQYRGNRGAIGKDGSPCE